MKTHLREKSQQKPLETLDAVPADPQTYWSAVDAFIDTLPKRRD